MSEILQGLLSLYGALVGSVSLGLGIHLAMGRSFDRKVSEKAILYLQLCERSSGAGHLVDGEILKNQAQSSCGLTVFFQEIQGESSSWYFRFSDRCPTKVESYAIYKELRNLLYREGNLKYILGAEVPNEVLPNTDGLTIGVSFLHNKN